MGENLLGTISEATGLPQDMIYDELARLITCAGLQKDYVTLDDLRQILAEYVQDVLLAAKCEAEEAAK